MPISKEYVGDAKAPADMKNFYFVRHGQTPLNTTVEVIDGEKHWGVQGAGTDTSLNKNGQQQAYMAANVLRGLTINKIVCSPLKRALQTAIPAKIPSAHFTTDDNLKERDFGHHEGGLGPLQMFEDNYPDCENTRTFSNRVAKALEHVTDENVLLVSHGGVLRVIAKLLRVELLDEHLENGRVLHFTREGSNWTVQTYQPPVVLISGATRGIGKAIADDLIAHGYRLSLGARNVDALEKAFGPPNNQLHYARFDAEKFDTMNAWVVGAAEKFGRIDGLVNNAGYGEHVDLAQDIDYQRLQKQWTINCVAPLRLTELCMPYLKSAGSGRIVNINSMSGVRVLNTFVGYNMTKAALGGLTKTSQHVGWVHGVRAIDICPGFVATEMSAYTPLIDAENMIQPEHIAELVRQAIRRPNNAFVPKIEVMCMNEATR